MKSELMIKFDYIAKEFPGVKALDGVSFEIKKGEVHALLGENGAGKSTLLNIFHGVYPEYEGKIYINNKLVQFKNANDAIMFGISKVHQEVNLVQELTVGQNIVLGYEPKKGIFIDYKKLHKEANEILRRLRCKFKSEDLVTSLSTGEMQMISIAKALYHKAEIISFDEPTASLSNKEADTLFEIIKELQDNGITIIYVSHRLDEIFKIADRATILRDGKFVDTLNIKEVTREQLIKKMVGRDVSAFAVRNNDRQYKEEIVLRVENLTRNDVFEAVSFELRKGEILGFAGLVGSKRTDVVRAIFGADKKSSGQIYYKGKKVEITSTKQALKIGIGLIPENRKTQGFIKGFTNSSNVGLTCMDKFTKNGFVNHNKKDKNCEHFIAQMNLNPKDPHYFTANLSGGNQQKVVIAKWLSTEVDILILDEPTKGVDVGAKAEIYRLLEELVAKGKSIIMVSSELPEIIGMSDRVVIMHEGRKIKELNYDELSEEKILNYAMGGKQ